MQAFILAGGKGERLRPITDAIPKPLIKLNKLTLIEYWINFFKKNGVTDLIISVGYLGDKIIQHVGDGNKYEVRIRYTKEEQPLGTAGALKLATDMLADKFFMVNCDNMLEPDLKIMEKELENAEGILTGVQIPDVSNGGALIIKNNYIESFAEKAQKGPGMLSAGFYLLKKEVLKRIPEGNASMEKQVFPNMAKEGKLKVHVYNGRWTDVGTIERLELARKLFPEV